MATAPVIAWKLQFGSRDQKSLQMGTYSYALTTGLDGSIYIGGNTFGTLDGQTFSGKSDAFLTKYSADGAKVWTGVLGTTSSGVTYALTAGLDGSIYVAGITKHSIDGQTTSSYSDDAFLTKYGADGTKAWTRLLGSGESEGARALTTGLDGSIFVGGYTYSNQLDGQTISSGGDAFLTKYSSDGTKLWTKLLGTGSSEGATALTTGLDGSIFVSGTTGGSLDGQTYSGNGDAHLTKYDSNGNKVWTRLLGTPFQERANALTTGLDGSIYVGGVTYGSLDGQTNSRISANGGVAFLTKYSADGTKVWTSLLGTPSSNIVEIATSIQALTTGLDGSIFVSGTTGGSLDGQTYSGEGDAFLTKYDSNGNKIWTSLLGTRGFEGGRALTTGLDGSIYIGGVTTGSLVAGQNNNYYQDSFLVKYQEKLVATPTYSLKAAGASVSEGSTATFTLITANVTAGTSVSYTLSGISVADLSSGSLSGTTTVETNGQATISVFLANDNLTEGVETLTVSAGGASASAQINDTSQTPSTFIQQVNVENANTYWSYWYVNPTNWSNWGSPRITLTSTLTGNTPLKITAVGSINTDAYVHENDGQLHPGITNAAGIYVAGSSNGYNPGTTTRVPLNLPNGTLLNTSASWGALLIGNPEIGWTSVFNANLDNGLGSINPPTNLSISTSLNTLIGRTLPLGTVLFLTYNDQDNSNTGSYTVSVLDTTNNSTLSLVSLVASVNEGSAATFTLTTTNVAAGTSVPYTLSGISAADLSGGSLTGNAIVNSSGVATISVILLSDSQTEGAETLIVTAGGATASTVVYDTSTYEAESNNTPQLANAVALAISGQLSSSSDLDYYKVTVSSGGNLIFSFDAPTNSSADYFKLSLYNSAGLLLSQFTTGSDKTYIVGVAAADTYYIAVASGGPFSSDQYTLTTSHIANSASQTFEYESNNTTATANAVELGQTIKGQFSSTSDLDYYKFAVPSAGNFTFKYDLPSDAYSDVKLSLYNSAGLLLSQFTTGSFSSYTVGVAAAGTYYISLANVDTYNLSSGQYGLTASHVSTALTSSYVLATTTIAVNEGSTATFNLTTTNVASGTLVPYTISGINAADLASGSLSGTTTVASNGQATIFVLLANDNLTEGTETLTVTAGGASASTQINDTSKTASATYAVSTNWTSTTEGTPIVVTLSTTNVSAGTTLYYQLSGSGITTSDLGGLSLTGSSVINSQGQATLTIPLSADTTTEGDETFAIQYYTDSGRSITAGSAASITILDSSKSFVTPTYSVSSSSLSVNEGSIADFIITTNVSAGSNIAYILSGILSSDITGGALTGNATVNASGIATVSIPIAADSLTEGTETLTINLQGKTASILINDTSKAAVVPTYSLAASSATVNEGSVATFTLTTTGVTPGTSVSYTISGVSASDVTGGLSGVATIDTNGLATISVPVAADFLTEGTETLTVTAQGKSASIEVSDTSKTTLVASYALSASTNSVSEGSSAVFTLITTNVAGGTSIPYTISGVSSGDITGGALSGTAIVSSSGNATITIPLALDLTTEGVETLTVVAQGNSASITVNDTSKSLGGLVASSTSVDEGKIATFVLTNVAPGTSITYTLSGVEARDISAAKPIGSTSLAGGAGDDTLVAVSYDSIYGGAGVDTVVYSYDKNDYQISKNPTDGSYAVIFKTGTVGYVASDVEKVTFRDTTVDLTTYPYYGNLTPVSANAVSSVYRFFNALEKVFFYTNSTSERDAVFANSDVSKGNVNEWPFVYQGSTFEAAHSYSGTVTIQRFYNTLTHSHFYSCDPVEIANVKAKGASGEWPFVFEGPAFLVYASDPNPDSVGREVPVERFYSSTLNRHWLTADPDEIAQIMKTGLWTAEGIAFWGEGPVLSGTTTVNASGVATISVPISADGLTEGAETLTVTAQGITASIVINDTSKVSLVPSYKLTAASATVNEGALATFTLSTTNVVSGTSIAYTISGVSAADLTGGVLTGSAVVNSSGEATISIPIAADTLTEGNETLTITAQSGTASVTILDTSKTAVVIPTYTLTPATLSVNEGELARVYVNTTNVAAGTVLQYGVSGVSSTDLIGDLIRLVTVDSLGQAFININTVADQLTEGPETMYITLGTSTTSLIINDTSVTLVGIPESGGGDGGGGGGGGGGGD